MDDSTPEISANSYPATGAATDVIDDRVYLVPYKWWKETQLSESSLIRGVLYTASSQNSSSYGMKIISNILFSSDLVFNLRKDDNDDFISNGDSEDGRVYALVPFDLWSKAIKWHGNVASDVMGMGADVYPLKLKISVLRETNIMTVRVGKRDNTADNYKRACKIFSVDSEVVRLWDFSGQTNLIFMNEWNRLTQDGQRQADQEIPLEIQVYAVSEILNSRNEGKKDDLAVQHSKVSSLMTNGFGGISKAIGPLGLVGLENLGNTCFMNSAIQCLAHTPKLVDYFLGDYSKEINHHNPLGMDGEIAIAFGEVLRKLWSIERTPVVPRVFKTKLAHFAPQFSGFNQHDSQELLAFLLDGLHEDLNRVKAKPYKEVKDEDGRRDEEVADEYWSNHLARNDSIIVDLCQGQYRSTLVCPVCHKVSVMFDPFMYLSLPLPSSTIRTMTITVFSTDGSAAPLSYTINVSKNGQCKDLLNALSIACSLKANESLLLAEVYSNRIIRYLEDPSDSISLIRDGDRLAAYRLLKENENLPLVVFTHQRTEHYFRSTKKPFGVPLIATLPNAATGRTIQDIFLKLMNPFIRSQGAASNVENDVENSSKDVKMDSSNMIDNKGTEDAAKNGDNVGSQFEFYHNSADEKNHETRTKIEIDDLVSLTGESKQVHTLVNWEDKALEMYDIKLLISLPEIYKPGLFMKKPEPISLYACLDAFLKDEPLGPEDMWFCPGCKKHQQATKKLDLWRLPEILVIHLKRFSYSRFMKNKLDTFVDFPIHDLDLSQHIAYKTQQPSPRYSLYAISNHYGNMGGGHYTAYAYHEEANRWYDFDDRHVHPISDENSIKSSSAYVLFYRRLLSEDSNTQSTIQPEDSNTQPMVQTEDSSMQSMAQSEDTVMQSHTLIRSFSDIENPSE